MRQQPLSTLPPASRQTLQQPQQWQTPLPFPDDPSTRLTSNLAYSNNQQQNDIILASLFLAITCHQVAVLFCLN